MEDGREDGPGDEIDRLTVLYCFRKNKFAVKWVEPSQSTFHELSGDVVPDAGLEKGTDDVTEHEEDEVVPPGRHEET